MPKPVTLPDLSQLTNEQLWKGRKMGELSKDEREEVLRRACKRLKAEMESLEFQDAIKKAGAL